MTQPFEVHVTVEKVIVGDGLSYVYGLDDEGFEVVYTPSNKRAKELAEHINDDANNPLEDVVPGHMIVRYSGEYGPWAAGRLPRTDKGGAQNADPSEKVDTDNAS